MTPKKFAEIWCAEAVLAAKFGEVKTVWWKRAYIWIVFKISPLTEPGEL